MEGQRRYTFEGELEVPDLDTPGLVYRVTLFTEIEPFAVITSPSVVTLRVDESLFFANSRFLEDKIYALVAEKPDLEHVVLMCPAVLTETLSLFITTDSIQTWKR